MRRRSPTVTVKRKCGKSISTVCVRLKIKQKKVWLYCKNSASAAAMSLETHSLLLACLFVKPSKYNIIRPHYYSLFFVSRCCLEKNMWSVAMLLHLALNTFGCLAFSALVPVDWSISRDRFCVCVYDVRAIRNYAIIYLH